MPYDSPRERRSAPTGQSAVAALKSALEGKGDVKPPGEMVEPILAPMIRVAIKQWLTEIQSEEELKAVRAAPRRKCMLYGPPGTGKTTLAGHLSARLGIPLVLVGPEHIIGSFLGDTTKAIGKLFDGLAESKVRCILFFDEIDALGAKRESHGSNSSAGSELKNAMTTLLKKVESFQGVMIGATNRKDAIDTALWRRFDLHLDVDLPGYDERWAILKRYGSPYDLSDDALEILADATAGASPALLENLMLGMKRALVLNPKLRMRTDDPRMIFAPIIASLLPPPGIDKPPLWESLDVLADLQKDWPPTLKVDPPPGSDDEG